MAFVEQRRHDLRRRTVDEARAGEHIEDLLALPSLPTSLRHQQPLEFL